MVGSEERDGSRGNQGKANGFLAVQPRGLQSMSSSVKGRCECMPLKVERGKGQDSRVRQGGFEVLDDKY